jgi:3-oxo-5alpha-steroid 4-dehydrogenase
VSRGDPVTTSTRALPADAVPSWNREADVVVVGHGGAGAAAAIEAARAGARTLVVERMSGGGGTTALSTGVLYCGGGTRVQRACGFDDPVEEMVKHVRLAAGAHPDEERVRRFCEGSVAHFEWLCALGVTFKDSYVDDKTTHPFGDDCLFYSGNERVHPFVAHATPAPRGHKPARAGEAGGYLMERLLAGSTAAGAEVVHDCRVERLVQRADGRIIGVAAVLDGAPWYVRARRGVVLCAGGFVLNDAMLAAHAPDLLRCNWKAAAPGDDGLGIRIGLGAGAAAVNMHEGLVLNAYYPPGAHVRGLLVNRQGQRFVNEDAYIGRSSEAILRQRDGTAWLIVDTAIAGRTQVPHRRAAVEATIEDLEGALDLPAGTLVQTVAAYNRDAGAGVDPLFHKAAEYLRPLDTPPYAALDCSTAGSIFGVLTLGGLAARASGEVLTPDGTVITGLYAAGRTTAGLPREGRTYASGLSISDATFFGRLAGQSAAAGAAAA